MQVEQIQIEKKRKLLKSHLKRLNQSDRLLRFFSPIKNELIDKYVEGLTDEKDICFAVYNYDRKKIVALAHIALLDTHKAELGMSVDSSHRGLGLGQALMKRVALYCKANTISDLQMECLRENQSMRCLAEKAGAKTLSNEDGEVSALAQFESDFKTRFAALLTTIQVENQVFMSKTMRKTLIRTRDFLEKMIRSGA